MNTEDEELLYKQVKRLDKSLEHACVQIDAQAEHIGELMKENANLKAEVKRNCKDRKKYLDERNKLKEQVKILSSKELMGKVLLEQEDALRELEAKIKLLENQRILLSNDNITKGLHLKAKQKTIDGNNRAIREFVKTTQLQKIKELEAENAKLKEDFSGIYETALNWEKQNERLRAEAHRQNDAAKYYCDLMLKDVKISGRA